MIAGECIGGGCQDLVMIAIQLARAFKHEVRGSI